MSESHPGRNSRRNISDRAKRFNLAILLEDRAEGFYTHPTTMRMTASAAIACLMTPLLLVIVTNTGGVKHALSVGIALTGIAAILGMASMARLPSSRGPIQFRPQNDRKQLAEGADVRSTSTSVIKNDLADMLQALATNEDASIQIRALTALRNHPHRSGDDAVPIISAIESFIRSRVPSATDLPKNTPLERPTGNKPEVQVGLEVLGSLPPSIRFSSVHTVRLRLDRLDLRGYNLRSLDFSAADLSQSNMRGCIIAGTLFDGADLRSADLSRSIGGMGASFRRAIMENTSLKGSFLPDSTFTGGLLFRTDLRNSTLARGVFNNAVLFECDLRRADLQGCKFKDVKIESNVGLSLSERVAAYR